MSPDTAFVDTHLSRHHDDDRCTAPSDKPSTQGTRKVVASLRRAPNHEKIGMTGVSNSQELSGYVPVGANESDVDTVVVSVRAHLVGQFLCLVGHPLLSGPVSDGCSGERSRCGSRGSTRGRTNEYCDGPAAESPRLAAGPAQGIPRRIGPVDPDDDSCAEGRVTVAVLMVVVLRAVVLPFAVSHDYEWP
jgi:hypothetical protein